MMKILFLLLAVAGLVGCSSTKQQFYVGTDNKAGIYRVEFDATDGSMKPVYQQDDVVKPGFLAFSPDRKFLYCVAGGNKIRSYKILADGQLQFLSERPSSGVNPCHIEVSRSGKAIVAANYGDGNVTVISVDKNGALTGTPRNHSHKHYPSPGTKKPQNGPRAHNVYMSPDGRYEGQAYSK